LDWLLSGLTILMNILLGKKIKWGWVLMVGISLLWIYYALTLEPSQFGLVPAAIANLVIAVPSAIKWFRDDRVENV
jgi:hypothetical protein